MGDRFEMDNTAWLGLLVVSDPKLSFSKIQGSTTHSPPGPIAITRDEVPK